MPPGEQESRRRMSLKASGTKRPYIESSDDTSEPVPVSKHGRKKRLILSSDDDEAMEVILLRERAKYPPTHTIK